MKAKKILFFICIIWLIGLSLFPRVVEVLNNNHIFLIDQGRDYVAVKNIVVNHKPTLIGAEVGSGMAGLQGLFHGPFYFYLLAIPFIIFHGDPYGGLLLMFAFGLLTIVVGFVFGKKVFGPWGGILLSSLIALSPPIISQSRFIWSPHPAAFFIILAFYFIYLSYSKNKRNLFLGAFFTGFIYNFEFAMAVPLSAAVFLYTLFLLRKQLQYFIFVLAGFVLAFIPLLIFEVKHGFKALHGLGNYLSQPSKTGINIDLAPFLHNFSDTFPKQTIIPLVLILLIFIIGLIFFVIKEKRKNLSSFIFFLSVTWLVTVIIMSFVKTHIFEYYLIHLNLITIFLFAYIIVQAYEIKHRYFQIVLTVIFATFLLYGTQNSILVTKYDLQDYGGMTKIRGKIDAINFIYDDAKGKQFGLFVFYPPVYTYPYDYLIWWHGQKKYHYLPHNEKKGLFYLLIEKDLGKPWSYKGWLETVIKTGKVVKTTELPSGFIIQKRVNE